MAINSVTGFGGFYNYRQMEIPKVDAETVRAQELQKQQNVVDVTTAEAKPVEPVSPVEAVDNRPRFADLENVSLTFKKNDDFAFLGADSDIKSPDMERAISDMQKDKIFQDYQFFVGTSTDVKQLLDNEDGKIIIK